MKQLMAALGDDIKPNGKNWVARCRVHNDKDFAMSIKQVSDGSVLAHCHACGANGLDLYRALDLDLDELYGGRKLEGRKLESTGKPYCPPHIREEYEVDKWVFFIYCDYVAQGKKISWKDRKRVNLARARIKGIRETYQL
jgi:hypothetical protein